MCFELPYLFSFALLICIILQIWMLENAQLDYDGARCVYQRNHAIQQNLAEKDKAIVNSVVQPQVVQSRSRSGVRREIIKRTTASLSDA